MLAFLAVGCGFKYQTTVATSEVEGALLSYTGTFAARLGVRVRGEIATNRTPGQAGNNAAGWYLGGVAYYYRPAVAESVTLVDGECHSAPRCELAGGVAAHEVCHAKWSFHDTHHWCCMKNLGVRPTYPPPVAPGGQWPACEGGL